MKPTQPATVAISSTAKQFIADQAASFSALNKGGDMQAASHRELVDAMVEFVENNRYAAAEIAGNDGEFEAVEIDNFEIALQSVMSRRLDTVRVRENTISKKLEAANQELVKMRAMLDAMQAKNQESCVS